MLSTSFSCCLKVLRLRGYPLSHLRGRGLWPIRRQPWVKFWAHHLPVVTPLVVGSEGGPKRGSCEAGVSQLARKYSDIYRTSSSRPVVLLQGGLFWRSIPRWEYVDEHREGSPGGDQECQGHLGAWRTCQSKGTCGLGLLSVSRTPSPPSEAADWVLGLPLSQRPQQENKLSVLRGGGNSSLFKNRRGGPVAMTNFLCCSMFLN